MKKFLNIFPRLRTIALARFSILFPLLETIERNSSNEQNEGRSR